MNIAKIWARWIDKTTNKEWNGVIVINESNGETLKSYQEKNNIKILEYEICY
jgi:hypothetical protein